MLGDEKDMKFNKNNMKFIRTESVEAADKLRKLGFVELSEPTSPTFCFINNGKIVFEAKENECVYTNIICL